MREGDRFEIRGPIGGYFVWDGSGDAPVLLIAGGSGVVPLMSMIRHRARTGSRTPTRLLYSSRTLRGRHLPRRARRPADGLEVFQTLTRSQPPGWTGYARRIDAEMLGEVAFPAGDGPRVFVCGSTRFVDTAADALVAMGYPPQSIRTERFGATG